MTAKGPLWNVLGAGIASSPASRPSRGGEAGVNLEAISVTGIADDLVELAIVGDDPKKTKRSLNSSDAHSCGRRTLPPVAVSHLATSVARE